MQPPHHRAPLATAEGQRMSRRQALPERAKADVLEQIRDQIQEQNHPIIVEVLARQNDLHWPVN